MTVRVVIDAEKLREALKKIYDTEILFKVTDSGVILKGFNLGDTQRILCDVRKSVGASYPERLFPVDEIKRWLEVGEKIEITFTRGLNIKTYRKYEVRKV